MLRIKELRKQKGWTQMQFANSLNVSQPTIVNWESIEIYPPSGILPQIAELLGCSIDDLYDKPQSDSA